MKTLLLILALALGGSAQAPTKTTGLLSPEQSAKLLYLLYEKVMSDAMYEMDMHWGYRLALAEKKGDAFLVRELRSAPRTIGDGSPWPEHFWKRAERTKAAGAKKAQAYDEYVAVLLREYPGVSMMTMEADGKIRLSQ